jgi:hypothetical protein
LVNIPLLRKDPIFLNFIGVVGEVANFDKDFTIYKKGLAHLIFSKFSLIY